MFLTFGVSTKEEEHAEKNKQPKGNNNFLYNLNPLYIYNIFISKRSEN